MVIARNENNTPLGRFIRNKLNSKDWVIERASKFCTHKLRFWYDNIVYNFINLCINSIMLLIITTIK